MDRLIDMKDVGRATTIIESVIYAMMSKGFFPRLLAVCPQPVR
jgi:predicted DNA-binding transcriptional regulator AlpA